MRGDVVSTIPPLGASASRFEYINPHLERQVRPLFSRPHRFWTPLCIQFPDQLQLLVPPGSKRKSCLPHTAGKQNSFPPPAPPNVRRPSWHRNSSRCLHPKSRRSRLQSAGEKVWQKYAWSLSKRHATSKHPRSHRGEPPIAEDVQNRCRHTHCHAPPQDEALPRTHCRDRTASSPCQ